MAERIKTSDKHSVVIAGHATSLTLEPEFWAQLKRIALLRQLSLAALIAEIDQARATDPKTTRNLSSALRLYVLDFIFSAERG